jgi:hypothetical protein
MRLEDMRSRKKLRESQESGNMSRDGRFLPAHIAMSARSIRPAPANGAKSSRRAALRACTLRREGRRSWIRPFRRLRRATDVTLRLIESSRRAIDACETLAAEHPLRAGRQLDEVSGWLAEASEQLGRGVKALSEANDQVARVPAYAGGAPRLLIVATARWIDAAAKLVMLSNRLDDSSTALVDYVTGGTAPLDLSELLPKAVPAPRRISFAVRRPSLKFLSVENRRIFCIHLRRQRSARVTVAEAPRRIVRGRAPPAVSTCSL